MSTQKLTTINKAYLLKERRDGFDEIQHGSLTLTMQAREGNEFTNFSQRFEIVACPSKDSKYKKGDIVWGHHFIIKQKAFDDLFYAGESQIWFKADKITDLVDDDIVVFQYVLHEETQTASGLTLINYNDQKTTAKEKGIKCRVVSGALLKGSEMRFYKNRQQEVWQNEEQYLLTDKKFITEVNGVPYGQWYEAKLVDDIDLYKQYKTRIKKGFIVLLNNPELPYHSELALVQKKPVLSFVNHDEILALVEIPDTLALEGQGVL